MKGNWYIRKDGVKVFKKGRYKVIEIFKRPHGGYCVQIFEMERIKAGEGYFGTSLPKMNLAVTWGLKRAKELKII